MCRISLFAIAMIVATNAMGAGHLVVEGGWIRTAPPNAMMLAGYATLHNVGDAAVIVTGAESADFGSVARFIEGFGDFRPGEMEFHERPPPA